MKKGLTERILTVKIDAWAFILFFLLGMALTVTTAWFVWYKSTGGEKGGSLGDIVMGIAKAPDPFIKVLLAEKKVAEIIQPQIKDFDQFAGLKSHQQDVVDDGFLLISAYSDANGVSSVFLYDLASQKIVHEWIPPIDDLLAQTTYRSEESKKHNFRSQHPLLLDNGDVLITSGEGPLLQLSACNKIVWSVDRHFHHSIERADSGELYVPIVSQGLNVPFPLRNDGVAKVSADGRIIDEWSIYEMLSRHGYEGLLLGFGRAEWDRMHLNDIEPIATDDEFTRAGDLMLSIRNLSTVLLYRPSTDEVIWAKTGPWINQHDVDYLGNGIFTIYGNDMVRAHAKDVSYHGYNTIWQYDQKTDEVSAFLSLEDVSINTITEGRHRVLGDGDVIVEDTNAGLIHRVNQKGLVWSYAHGLGNGKIGALHWSRYLKKSELDLNWLEELQCQ
ncbi:hypothetical protein HBA55_20975 [Pseudomaricurvus alkylphenolicus]|uniref:arylsulfotransferase family protein n=1 Tax=Pseudomaricurvus alkylphenolicus TaxID=1306991 RepID=UPI00141E4C86|nr:arylsulfotransferase family protein [Pseudomaricurvus alkylphenolicus]NIB42092.1 hypothetical protein [Pseudomaricurvus alkylphenolicus]